MNESTGEKTEQPTDKRLRDSKEKGQVPQTKQAVSMVVVIVGSFYIYFTFGLHADWINDFLDYCIDFPSKTLKTFRYDFPGLLMEYFFYMILPLPVLLASLVVLTTQIIAGGVFSFESLKPKPEKFNPAKNIKNMFSLASLYSLLFGLVIGVYATIVGYTVFQKFRPDLAYSVYCGLMCEAAVLSRLIFTIIMAFAILLAIFILLDVKIQHMIYIKNMKMTKDEVKREHKQNEGDPMIKGQRKQIAKENIEGPRPADIAFVIAGSEISLGFVFDREDYPVPFLAFKTRDEGAKQMVRYAKSMKKPVDYSDKLVNDILKEMKLNQFAPKKLFPIMQEIVQRHGL